MASLTHVCMWTKSGWKQISAENARQIYPFGTVSANSGLFMCELCGQFVSLPNVMKQSPHFRHRTDTMEKSCPERLIGTSSSTAYKLKELSFPIRIQHITRNNFDFELGLLPVPESILVELAGKSLEIQPKKSSNGSYQNGVAQFYRYSITDRLLPDRLTYVSVGDKPASEYIITVEGKPFLNWPTSTCGVLKTGSLFDTNSHKRLPLDADVVVGTKYYLLTQKSVYPADHVKVERICERKIGWETWRVYIVEATEFTEDAAAFFIKLQSRLTQVPISLQPLWPLYNQTPYLLKHNQDHLFMYLKGSSDIGVSVVPFASLRNESCPSKKSKVVRIHCDEQQQIISAGRLTKTLKYTYCLKCALKHENNFPEFEVTDVNGNAINAGTCYDLPLGNLLVVKAKFDGYILVKQHGKVAEKRPLQASVSTDLMDVHYGCAIAIFQGLDEVCSITFEKKKMESNAETDEAWLLQALKIYQGDWIPFPTSAKSWGPKLRNYPLLRRWLVQQYKKGEISNRAYKSLKVFILKQKLK